MNIFVEEDRFCTPRIRSAQPCPGWRKGILWLMACSIFTAFGVYAGAPDDTETNSSETEELKPVVEAAFAAVHDGWSSDEVLLQDGLNSRFIAACHEQSPTAAAGQLNWLLINLRKANELKQYPVTRRAAHRHDAYRHAAEIAARLVTDQYEVSTDRMLCDPKLRAEFDQAAQQLATDVPAYRLRKAAFGLRKSRQLRPELVVRVANWGREIRSMALDDLRADTSQIPELPGVYIFRDEHGYLYVGEAADLRKRLSEHLVSSDRLMLAEYLSRHNTGEKATDCGESETELANVVTVEIHAFPADSPATEVRMRRAYESELIASRHPRFNVRP